MRLFYRLRLGALLMLGCLGMLLPTQLQAQERPVKDHRGTVAVPFTVAPGKHVAQNEEVLRYYNPEAEAFYVEDFFAEIPSFLVRISPSLTGELTELSFPLYNGPLLEGGSSIGVDGDGQVRVDLFEVEDPNVLPLLEEQGIATTEVDVTDLVASPQIPLPEDLNVIDLADAGFEVEAETEYFVRLLLIDADDNATLTFVTDAGSMDQDDTNYHPVRTYIYLRGDAPPSGGEEGYYIYPDHSNLLIDFTVSGTASTALETVGADVPSTYSLRQNYPNPFNPSTSIAFSVPRSEQVTLAVYNLLGKEVARLVDRRLAAGTYEATWNGAAHPSGVYLYTLQPAKEVLTSHVRLVK